MEITPHSPHHRALLLALRPERDDGAELRAALAQVRDWEGLLQAALNHGVVTSFYLRVAAACPEAAPPWFLAEMQRLYRLNARRNLRLTGELLQVLALLESHGIPAIPIKGPVLAQVAYGDLALRQFIDLDIMLRPQDIDPAGDLLVAAGYRRQHAFTRKQEQVRRKNFYDVSFLHPQREKLEVHWRLLDHQGGGPEAAEAFRRRVPVDLAGKTVYSLAPEDMLLLLCLHATFHYWSGICYINDVARVVQSQGPWDWPGLIARAARVGMRRRLLLGLRLAGELLAAPIPGEVLARAEGDREVAALYGQVMERLFKDQMEEPGLLARNLFHLQVRERLRDKLAYAWSRLGAPNEDDWFWLPLPDRYYWLYYAVRPLRVAAQGLLLPLWRRVTSS